VKTGQAALQEMAQPAVPTLDHRTLRSTSPRFYVGLSTACLAIAVVGFVPTYWMQLAPATFEGSPLLHLHAWLFSAWPLYLLVQTALAAQGQVARHRALGLFGISLATAIVMSASPSPTVCW
jgi:hypothetical protein